MFGSKKRQSELARISEERARLAAERDLYDRWLEDWKRTADEVVSASEMYAIVTARNGRFEVALYTDPKVAHQHAKGKPVVKALVN